jgi:tRNA threonylcarbamoyladenosine biosynthesis protein TsaE
MNYTTHNTTETQQVAYDFVSRLNPKKDSATVVGLSGDLGAGKTTFTQCVAQELGITETVVSPTFVIEKIYELENQKFTHLIHIDAYRLEHSDELVRLGWREVIADPQNLVLIEWPERVADIMPEHISIQFTHVSEGVREIEVKGLML